MNMLLKTGLLDKCNSRVFIGLAIMGYEPLNHALQKWQVHMWFSAHFYFYFSIVLYILGTFLVKHIIPLALVGYQMIIANSALYTSLSIYHLISNVGSWNDKLLLISQLDNSKTPSKSTCYFNVNCNLYTGCYRYVVDVVTCSSWLFGICFVFC